jgi:hypothetical protein
MQPIAGWREHIPAEMVSIWEGMVLSTWPVPSSNLENSWGTQPVVSWVVFYTGGYEESTWAHEAEEFPLLEAVARERLVKTEQAGKGLSGCYGDLWIVEISSGAAIACSSESCV